MNGWKNWVIGALFAVAVPLGSYSFISLANYTTRIEAQAATERAEISKQQNTNRERIAALEAQYRAIQESLAEIKASQERTYALLSRR